MSTYSGFLAYVLFCAVLICVPISVAQTRGPEKGWLVIHGGGAVSDAVKKRFVALAGGSEANFVLIPTAMPDQEIAARSIVQDQGRSWAKSWGVNHVTVLHTRDKVRADSDYFIETLRKASGVWIMGGRQWRLTDVYLNTAVEREIKALLTRGGVVGGSSAGASIQASFLVRGDPGTPRNPNGDSRIVIASGHTQGFGLLTNSAIDQHVNTRNREHDLLKVIEKHPELLGFGIDEGAAIVVHGDSLEVLGGQVAVYDSNPGNKAFYHFLSPGEKFSLSCSHVMGEC